MPTTEALRVEVVHAWPDRWLAVPLRLPAGACVADALEAAAGALRDAGIDPDGLGLAVFGRSAVPATRLHDSDRVELLRPLQASPRDARANRAAVAKRRGGGPSRPAG